MAFFQFNSRFPVLRAEQDCVEKSGFLADSGAAYFFQKKLPDVHSIFPSYPKPCYAAQQQFISKVMTFMDARGFAPRTFGADYDMDAPLKSIRRLMPDCNGLLTIAFRRTYRNRGKLPSNRHRRSKGKRSQRCVDYQSVVSD